MGNILAALLGVVTPFCSCSAVPLFIGFVETCSGVAHAELPSATGSVVSKALSSGKPTLIDIGARTCRQCKEMAPILETLAAEYRGKASVLSIDAHEDPSAAGKLYEIEFRPKRGGILGAFLLGLFFGVVSSPCATPVLVVLLTVVATKAQILYGVALLFCYAIGHCLLMLLAGTFTGFVEGFAKAKGVVNFSAWTKRFSGAVVALAGSWFFWQGI